MAAMQREMEGGDSQGERRERGGGGEEEERELYLN